MTFLVIFFDQPLSTFLKILKILKNLKGRSRNLEKVNFSMIFFPFVETIDFSILLFHFFIRKVIQGVDHIIIHSKTMPLTHPMVYSPWRAFYGYPYKNLTKS